MMKIGLFGGSFNPPHRGHVYISNLAIKKLGLNQIWWIPTKRNPLKTKMVPDNFQYNFQSRLEQCRQITAGCPRIKVKDFESDSIYTVKLVTRLKSRYKACQFYWIMGADNLTNFHQWKDFRQLMKIVTFAVFSRKDFLLKYQKTKAYSVYKSFLDHGASVIDKKALRFLIFRAKNLDISSSQIRKENV